MAEANSGLQQIQSPSLAFGLNLRDGVDAVGSGYAIDAIDVSFTERGGVRSRPGFQRTSASASMPVNGGLPSRMEPFYSNYNQPRRVAVASGNRVQLYDLAGAYAGAELAGSGGLKGWGSARFGTPAQDYLYFCNEADGIVQFDGATFTKPTMTVDGVAGKATPKCVAMAVMAKENRILWCGYEGNADGPGGAPSSPAHVFMSRDGEPLGAKALDFDQLRVGDGDRIMGAVSWREFTFVFKQRVFFAFTGTNTDAAGITRFYNRAVDNGIGLLARHACCAGRDGVYFVGAEGVYRTTGGEPELLSDLVGAIFTGAPSIYYSGGVLNRAAAGAVRIAYFDEKVYVLLPTGTSTVPNRMLVYDTQSKAWTVWAKQVCSAVAFDDGLRGSTLLCSVFERPFGTDSYRLQWLDDRVRVDDDGDFTGRWRGGFLDFGDRAIKTMIENKLWGYGLLTVRSGTDYGLGSQGFNQLDLRAGAQDHWSDGSNPADVWSAGDSSDTWGRSAPVSVAVARHAVRGTTFSVALEGLVSKTTVPDGWGVSTLSHHVLSPDWPTTERHSS